MSDAVSFKRVAQNAVPDDIRARIVAMYRTTSATRVAAHFGIHKQTVLNLVRLAGEPIRPPFYRVRA